MSFQNETQALTANTAIQIFAAPAGSVEIWVRANVSMYIGDSEVDADTGFSLPQPSIFNSHVRPGDELWAFTASEDGFAHVLVRSA